MIEKRIAILYGSQTGNAEEISELLWRQFKSHGFSGPVVPMDSYNIANLITEEFVIFVCSTTGDGEEPDNMKKFWRFLLKKSLPENSLMNMKFGVLGLGDSSYSKFNFVAKKLNKRLLQLGATQLLDLGLCDYQHDLGNSAVVDPWTIDLWKALHKYFPDLNLNDKSNVFVIKWTVQINNQSRNKNIESIEDLYFGPRKNLNDYLEKPFIMELQHNNKTTSDNHFQDVRLLEFKPVVDYLEDYFPGDVINIRPRNLISQVELFYKIFGNHPLNLHSDDVINISQIHDDMPVPKHLQGNILLNQLVDQYFDLSSVPRKYVFFILAQVSKNKLEKDKCIEFCSASGSEEFLNYCYRPKRNILEVLQDFHQSTHELSLNHVFEIFTYIKPRAFSIASSCKASENKQIDILVAVVKYFTKLKSERLGLCSNYLKNLQKGDRIFSWITKGTFKFPDNNKPLIMIGPGTGLAPFRSLILERNHFNFASKEMLTLFFGCRNENGDFHCKEFLKNMESSGKLFLSCAFSRDQDDKVYVQHKIEENSDHVWNLISNKSAYIFIAGNAKNMPECVKSTFKEIFEKKGKMDTEDAKALLQKLEFTKKFQLETW